jgi:hypothetical protein
MDAVLGVWALEYSRKGDPNHGMFSKSMRSILGCLHERVCSFSADRRARIRKIRMFGGFISRSGIKQKHYFIVKGKF